MGDRLLENFASSSSSEGCLRWSESGEEEEAEEEEENDRDEEGDMEATPPPLQSPVAAFLRVRSLGRDEKLYLNPGFLVDDLVLALLGLEK